MTGKEYKQLIIYTDRLADNADCFGLQLNNIESRVDKEEFSRVKRGMAYSHDMLKASSDYLYKIHSDTTVSLLQKAVDFMYGLKPGIIALAEAANAGKTDKDVVDFTVLLEDLRHFVGCIRNILCSVNVEPEPKEASALPIKRFDSVETMVRLYTNKSHPCVNRDLSKVVEKMEKTITLLGQHAGHKSIVLPADKHDVDPYAKVSAMFTSRGWTLTVFNHIVVFWAELPDGVRAIDFYGWDDARAHASGSNVPSANVPTASPCACGC